MVSNRASEYGEGDIFLGIAVPLLRRIALRFTHLSLKDIESYWPRGSMSIASWTLEILVAQHALADEERRQEIFDFYL